VLKLFNMSKVKKLKMRFVNGEDLELPIDECTHIMCNDDGILIVMHDESEEGKKEILALAYFPYTNILAVRVDYVS